MALGFNPQNFSTLNHPALITFILDWVARNGDPDSGVRQTPQAFAMNGYVDFRPSGAAREYRAEIAQQDEYHSFVGGDAALAARNEGRGAGILRCFRLRIYDRVLTQTQHAGARVVMVDAVVPYFLAAGGFITLDGAKLKAEPQAVPAAL